MLRGHGSVALIDTGPMGGREPAWSLEQPWGETPVPELYMRQLASWPRVDRQDTRCAKKRRFRFY
jgi:hypothetical protein